MLIILHEPHAKATHLELDIFVYVTFIYLTSNLLEDKYGYVC